MKKFEDVAHLYLGCKMIATKSAEQTEYEDLTFKKNDIGSLSLCQVLNSNVQISCNESDAYRFAVELETSEYACFYQFDHFKPVLKRLENITQEHAMHVFNMCHEYIYGEPIEKDNEISFHSTKDIDSGVLGSGIGLIIYEKIGDKKNRYSLTIQEKDISFCVDGDNLVIPVFDIFEYILKMGYDVYGLIDNGEAIDEANISIDTDTTDNIDDTEVNDGKEKEIPYTDEINE